LVAALLAVDLGVRTGFAAYAPDGRLAWYRSQNFGNPARLRRAVPGVLDAEAGLRHVIVEGGGRLARFWLDEAAARSLRVELVSAEVWRELMLYPREQRSGEAAKRTALMLARRVIDWSGAKRPTSLTHDAAEAILVGLWGALRVGLLGELPPGVVHGTPARSAGSTPPPAPPLSQGRGVFQKKMLSEGPRGEAPWKSPGRVSGEGS
jgi:hypothetical protein